MIWWKGNGLWMGALVGLIIFAAGKTSWTFKVPLGFLAAAVALFAMKNVFEGASLYSIPYKIWPPALLALSVLAYFSLK